MWRYLLPLGGFGVLAAFLYLGLGRDPGVIKSPLVGKTAPAFSLQSVQDPGVLVASEQYRGRPYVFNVWGTWCVGCRQEHETLMAIARSEAARPPGDSVPLVGLVWRDSSANAQRWLEQLGNPYAAVALDASGKTAIDWGVYGAPETYLIGADGRILHKHIAPMTLGIWERDFLPLIRGAGSTAR